MEAVLTVERGAGQGLEGVERAVLGVKPVEFFGRTGGIVPSPDEVKEQVVKLINGSRRAKGTKRK